MITGDYQHIAPAQACKAFTPDARTKYSWQFTPVKHLLNYASNLGCTYF
jgi:hypothetical protein